MEILITFVLLFVGLGILIVGADSLVKGSSSISIKAGIPPIVIGLTIVAFGTSAPELLVNLFAAVKGNTNLALGNIIGSNIANLLLILGLSAVIMNLKINKTTTWKEIPFSILACLAVFVMMNDIFLDKTSENIITRTDGLVLLGFFMIFLYYTFGLYKNKNTEEVTGEIKTYPFHISSLLTIGGLAGLFFGGQIFVNQAVKIASLLGMSETLIGLTIVAIGTSLPELVTSVMATYKGESDIAIGNVVGSNIFNIFWILGVTSTITPIPVPNTANTDVTLLLIGSLLLFTAMFAGKKYQLERWQGAIFLMMYVGYTGFLIYQG